MIFETSIVDCYTDEPAGLGVPPYLGVHPRYLAGHLKGKVNYLTIDDLRAYAKRNEKKKELQKTDIKTYNKTRKGISDIVAKTKQWYFIVGVQTPGKYLSAMPGTIKELRGLMKELKGEKILYGPVVSTGTQLVGGRSAEFIEKGLFDDVLEDCSASYDDLVPLAIKGAEIVKQIPWPKMIEIETGRGCIMGKCSFCTEPLKAQVDWREQKDIHKEMKVMHDLGEKNFRLGKQACIFSYKGCDPKELEKLLQPIGRTGKWNLDCLHIDNVIPSLVNEERTKLLVKYCTEGNIAAFGVESFDLEVVKKNRLNTSPTIALNAIRTINKIGGKRGPNGMHYLLPGINVVFGLIAESKKTGDINFKALEEIYNEGLLLRRINIRQVTPFPGTLMAEAGLKYLKKNKKYYWKWRNAIRQKIDYPMLQRLIPLGTVLRNVRMEIYDGNHTFGRQMGSYPLIVGVKKRIPLKKNYNIKITGHMLRSVFGEVV